MLARLRIAADRASAFLAMLLLVALLATVLLGVVTRALDAPLIWTDEVWRLLMVWLAVFGWIKGHFTGVKPWRAGLQTALVGGLAAAVAFGIARLIHPA